MIRIPLGFIWNLSPSNVYDIIILDSIRFLIKSYTNDIFISKKLFAKERDDFVPRGCTCDRFTLNESKLTYSRCTFSRVNVYNTCYSSMVTRRINSRCTCVFDFPLRIARASNKATVCDQSRPVTRTNYAQVSRWTR